MGFKCESWWISQLICQKRSPPEIHWQLILNGATSHSPSKRHAIWNGLCAFAALCLLPSPEMVLLQLGHWEKSHLVSHQWQKGCEFLPPSQASAIRISCDRWVTIPQIGWRHYVWARGVSEVLIFRESEWEGRKASHQGNNSVKDRSSLHKEEPGETTVSWAFGVQEGHFWWDTTLDEQYSRWKLQTR